MIDPNKTIHVNEQISASVREYVADKSADDLRAAACFAWQRMSLLRLTGQNDMDALCYAMANVKLLELVEQKERGEGSET